MLRMLGKLGDPGLLTAAFPTDPELSHYDNFLNCLVYQSRLDVTERDAIHNVDGFPVFELTTLSEPKPRVASSETRTGEEFAGRSKATALAEVGRAAVQAEQMSSSIYDVGSWITWPIPAWS
jgi:hypothetical protein